MYINTNKDEYGAYGNIMSSQVGEDFVFIPDAFVDTFINNNGFVNITIDNNCVISCTPNEAARNAWLEATQSEREIAEIATLVAEAKQYLADTDYVVIKIAEGAATREEYEDIINQRIEARATINKYEN